MLQMRSEAIGRSSRLIQASRSVISLAVMVSRLCVFGLVVRYTAVHVALPRTVTHPRSFARHTLYRAPRRSGCGGATLISTQILSDIICDGVFVGGGGLVMLDLPDDPACFFGDNDTKNDGVVLGAGKTSGDRGGRPVRCGDRQGS